MTLTRMFSLFAFSLVIMLSIPPFVGNAYGMNVSLDSLLAEAATSEPVRQYPALCMLRQHYKPINSHQAIEYARKAVATARKLDDPVKMGDALNNLAILYTVLHVNDSALITLTESLEYYSNAKDNTGIAKVYSNLGIAFAAEFYFKNAVLYYNKAISLFISIGDKRNLAISYTNLGQVYEKIGDPAKAISYFEMAGEIFKSLNDNDMLTYTEACTGIAHNSSGNHDQGLLILIHAKDYYLEHGKTKELGIIYQNLGRLYSKKGLSTEARQSYFKALQIAENIGVSQSESEICMDIAELYLNTGMTDSTLRYLKKSEKNIGKSDSQLKQRFYLIYSNALVNKEKYKDALTQYTLYSRLRDSLNDLSRMRSIEELDSNYLKNLNRSSLDQFVRADTLNRNRHWILAGFSLAGFFFSFLVMALLYQKRQSMARKKEIAELERVKAEHEKRLKESELKEIQLERSLQEEEIAKVKAEMQLREQELVFQTLCRMDLAQVNKKVHERLLPFHINFPKKKDQDDYVRTLNEITRESNRDSLADFEVTFTQLHHGFFERLLATAPELSKSEIMVCALLRLNLSSKDIARLLNLSLSTIDVTRHHIRRKLGLDAKDNLTAFLISI